MVTDPDRVPKLAPDDDLAAAMHEIAYRQGTVPVVDPQDHVIGVITAGDLTRFADGRADFLSHRVKEAMNASPKTMSPDTLAIEAVRLMQKHGIMAMPVVEPSERLLGMVHLHDLLAARLS